MDDMVQARPLLALALLIVVSGCGGGVQPTVFNGSIRAGSLECAEDRLLAANYEVDVSDDVVDGQLQIMSDEVAVRREFIRVSTVSPNDLQVRVTAQLMEPAAEPTVTRPLIAVPADPLSSTLTTAEVVVEACGG